MAIKANGTRVEDRIFRLEMMMYFVVAKLGFDTVGQVAPIITSIWRSVW